MPVWRSRRRTMVGSASDSETSVASVLNLMTTGGRSYDGQEESMPGRWSRRCQAVVFDLDGVLVDSEPSFRRHWCAWADSRGLDGPSTYAVGVGIRTVDHVRMVAPDLDAEQEARVIEGAVAADPGGITALPGAQRLLNAFPEGTWGIVTSSVRGFAVASLRAAGLPVPGVLITGDDVAAGKPDPDGYLRAARAMRADPQGIVVVEDAPPGVQAAKVAGAAVIAVLGTHARDQLGQADLVVNTLADLNIARDGGPAGQLLLSTCAPRCLCSG
jgi:mannitol-1-/sugar-/sorbitol-6-phosphatase